jgi:phosphate transport system permease protein
MKPHSERGSLPFRVALTASTFVVTGLIVALFLTLSADAWPAIARFKLGFLFETTWDPVKKLFGAGTFIVGTLITSFLALVISLPFSLAFALMLGEYFRFGPINRIMRVFIDLLASVPSVVYGLWGIAVLIPIIRSVETAVGVTPYGVGIFTSALVLAIMIIPYSSSIATEVIRLVPDDLRAAGFAIGATRGEVIMNVVFPYARSGILAGVMLSLGRALGQSVYGIQRLASSGRDGRARPRPVHHHNHHQRDLTPDRHALQPGGHKMSSVPAEARYDHRYAPHIARRRTSDAVFRTLVIVLGVLAVAPFFVIIFHVARQGISAIDWNFLTRLPKPVGEAGGGILNAIVGTLIIIALSTLFSVPLGVMVGIYLSENKRTRLGYYTRLGANVLQSVPSIVVGIVMYAWLVRPVRGYSAIAGGVALAVMMLPIVVKNTEEVLNLVPEGIKEGALALGVPYHITMLRMLVPSSLGGILSGVLLAIARVAGETAPLLFTAFGNPFFNANILKPMDAIPLIIYNYAKSPYQEWIRMAWGASFVLIVMIFVLNLAVRLRRNPY